MATAQPPTKKARRPNFSDAESLALIEAVTARRDVLLNKFDNEVTARAKAAAWEEVKQEVNNVSRVGRTTDEVRRKYKDLRVAVKRKAGQETQHMGGTGRLLGKRKCHFIPPLGQWRIKVYKRLDTLKLTLNHPHAPSPPTVMPVLLLSLESV